MSKLIGMPKSEADLEPRIIVMGTTQLFRVREVGEIWFVEQDKGAPTTERWEVIAVSKGEPDSREEAIAACCQCNRRFLEAVAEDAKGRKLEHMRQASLLVPQRRTR